VRPINVFRAETKAQREKVAEEYCWATTRAEAFTLLSITLQCVGVWISTGLPCIYIYSWSYALSNSDLHKIRVALDIPAQNYCVSVGECLSKGCRMVNWLPSDNVKRDRHPTTNGKYPTIKFDWNK